MLSNLLTDPPFLQLNLDNLLNQGYGRPKSQVDQTVEYLRNGEISDFLHVQEQAYFSEPCCDQTSVHTNNQLVPNERYGHFLSIDTPYMTVLQVVWHLQSFKLGHFLKKKSKNLWKIILSMAAEILIFRRFFSIHSHSQTNHDFLTKPKPNGLK